MVKKINRKTIKEAVEYFLYSLYCFYERQRLGSEYLMAEGAVAIIISFSIASFIKEIFIDLIGIYDFFQIKMVSPVYFVSMFLFVRIYFTIGGKYKKIVKKYKQRKISEEERKKKDLIVSIFIILFLIYFFYHMAVDYNK